MKNKHVFVALFAVISSLSALAGPKLPPKPVDLALQATPIQLQKDQIQTIYIGPGTSTSLCFKSKKKVDDIFLGSDIITADWNDETSILKLYTKMSSGRTNLNVLIDGVLYDFIVQIVTDGRVFHNRTVTVAGEENDERLAAAANAPILRPDEIDTVSMVNVVEKYDLDKKVVQENPNVIKIHLDLSQSWNNSPVTLKDLTFFPETDTLVFRFEFSNQIRNALYLHKNQYKLYIANKEIQPTVRQQLRATVYPGQVDTTYLFVQGHRTSPYNQWRFELPPEAEAVRKVLSSR